MAEVGLILLFEPDACAVGQLSAVLETTGFVMQQMATLAELAMAAVAHPRAVVMASMEGADSEMVLAQVAASPLRQRTLLLAEHADFGSRLAAARCGAAHLLRKPVDPVRLLPILERLGRDEPETPYRVLIVGDDHLSNLYHAALLQAAGIMVSTAESGERALEMARQQDPDLILPDYYLGDCTGAELVAMLRDDDRLAQLRVIFLSGRDVRDLENDVFDILGEDFVTKPVDTQSFVSLVRSRAAHARRARRLNDELRLSQRATRNVRQALDAHAIVSVTDIKGDLIYVNDKFCRTNGYRREELLGKNHRLIRSGVHSDAYYANIWQTLEEGRVWQGELCNRTRNGDLYWMQSTIMPSVDEAGLPYQYVSVSTDISVQKEVESRLFTLLNTANVGLVWVDQGRHVVDLNDTVSRMLGYSREEMLALHSEVFTHPDDREMSEQHAERIRQGASTVRFQKRYVRKNGEVVWADVMLSRVENPDGQLRGMVASLIDITRQKVAENRLRLVVRGSLDGIWDWSAETGEIYYSRRFREMLGFGAAEADAFGQYFRLPRVIHPDDYRQARAALTSHLCRCDAGVFDIELRFLHRDGRYRWFRARGKGVWDEKGRPERFAGSFTDISAFKEVEAAMRQAKELAEQASRAKTDFLSRMTHELRTPLNAILGFAQLLESDPVDRPSPGQAESLAQIQRAGWHLLDLINEVLDLARIEAGRLEVSVVDFPVSDIVSDCLTLISMLASKHGVTIINRLSEVSPPVLRADPMRLKQALLNLLSNAVKYNRPGGQVHIDAAAVEGGWRLDISDTGIGMTPEQLAVLFQPFTRFVGDDQREGSGIGLAITRRLVEAMGGFMEVRSTLGVGSVFSVTLPAGQLST